MMSDTTTKESKQDLASNEELQIYQKLKPYIAHCLSMNHELNNPLAVIMGYAEVLHEECKDLSDNQKQYLSNIIKGAEKIQKCITDLSEEKIALSEKIDLKNVVELYNKDNQKSD